MKELRAFRIQLRTNSNQELKLSRFVGCKRFVYNKALEIQNELRERGEKILGYAGLCKLLTEWRHQEETAFLSQAPTHPLQQALKDLERAFSNFFAARARFPRFKKRKRGDSIRYPDPKQIKLDEENSRIFLPKLGWIRYRKSREIEGTVKQVTVSRDGGAWFISIQTEQVIVPQEPVNDSAVGIDLGIAFFATLSDGTVYSLDVPYGKYEERIAREQRNLSRKVKFSGKWRKQVQKSQRLYRSVLNSRLDFQHKTSAMISKNHAVVVVEDLNIKGMSASASGTLDNPGTNVKAKSGLNKSILRQAWNNFLSLLQYKVENAGGLFLAVSAKHTSCKCSVCGFVSKENRKSQSKFVCIGCGHCENADLNAARNILAAGLAVKASGEKSKGISSKGEPTVSAEFARVIA